MTSKSFGTRVVALSLAAALTGCAPRAAMAPSAFAAQARPPRVADDPALIRRFVEQLPIGSHLTIVETSGAKSTVLLMAVDQQGIVVRAKTRIPEPARTVSFDRLARVEPANKHDFAKGFWIGTAVGAGSFFLFLLSLVANGD